jgi:hypothetical protein
MLDEHHYLTRQLLVFYHHAHRGTQPR